MPMRIVCDEKSCGECGDVIARTYRELRDKGYSDRDAFMSAVNLLELRHPGRERYYYFRCTAKLLGGKRQINSL
jgi:hypothetical protein